MMNIEQLVFRRSVPDEYFEKLLADGVMKATEKADIGQGGQQIFSKLITSLFYCSLEFVQI
jgi:hypothetical protein